MKPTLFTLEVVPGQEVFGIRILSQQPLGEIVETLRGIGMKIADVTEVGKLHGNHPDVEVVNRICTAYGEPCRIVDTSLSTSGCIFDGQSILVDTVIFCTPMSARAPFDHLDQERAAYAC